MKQIFFFLFLVLTSVCFGQINNVIENAINFDDIIEINDLMYFKADTTLVTGKIVRYNRKNKPKQFIEVVEGKPQNHNWINFEEDFVEMEYDGLGTLVSLATAMTGIAMAASGNDLDTPIQNNNLDKQGHLEVFDREERYNAMLKTEEEKRMISKNLNSSSKPYITSESKTKIKLPENGLYEEFYKSKSLRIKGNFINSKKNGIWQEWYENGQLKSRVEYLDGKKIGRLDTYHDNGQLKGRVNYVDGKEEREIMVYNEQGEIIMIGIFKEGIQVGEWKYFENGILIYTENFD